MSRSESAQLGYTDSADSPNQSERPDRPYSSLSGGAPGDPLHLSVKASGKVRVTFEAYPERLAAKFSSELLSLCNTAACFVKSTGLGVAANDAKQDSSPESSKKTQIKKQTTEMRHLGRLAERWLRTHESEYRTHSGAVRAAAEHFAQPVTSILALVQHHRRWRKVRYDRFIDRRIIRLYSEGSSYGQIADEVGLTSKTVARRAKQAMSELGNFASPAPSQSGHRATPNSRNGV